MDRTEIDQLVLPHSPEWFRLRCGAFTASEIWKLFTEPREKKKKEAGELSKTAETYILEKVHEKITGQVKNSISNYATEWGIEYEPLAVSWYSKLTKKEVFDPYLVFHPTIKNFSCTPDGFVEAIGLVEVKCPANGANHFKHCFITTDEYFKQEFPEYYWQCQAQMAITGRRWCDFVSFDPRVNTDLGMFIYRLERNIDNIELMYHKLELAQQLFDDYLKLFNSGNA